MTNTHTIDELGWLHDAVVHRIEYDATTISGRQLSVTLSCNKHSGSAEWAGKQLLFIAHDVLVMRHLVWSTAGKEQLNTISGELSQDARDQLRMSSKGNSRFSGQALTMTFHSGSSLEMICKDFEVLPLK